jgi:hypothetical protein
MPAAPILTGDPNSGIITYFALGDSAAPTVVQDISDFLTNVDPGEDTDEQEATTFRRQSKRILAGFSDIKYTLTGYYSEEAYEFFAPLRKMEGVAFEYGPGGNAVGKTKISGLCTVFSFPDPSSDVNGVPGITVELKITERTVGTFAALADEPAAAPAAGIPAKRGRAA